MSVPSSVIHILSGVPVNSSYEHSLYFPTKSQQITYFNSKKVKTLSNFTYIRPSNSIKVAGDVANARAWNYLMFQNDTGKWYYNFIDKVTYLSDSSVELHITMDVIQTYMFDWDLKPCFVERTHTSSDEFGEHTVPEGLETGPLISSGQHEVDLEDNCILLLMSCNQNGGQAWGKAYGGVYSGLAVYAVQLSDVSKLNDWLQQASTDGYVDAIVSMWMYPKKLVSISGSWTDGETLHIVSNVADTFEVSVTDSLYDTDSVAGQVVKNRKTLCYPYTMLYVSNNLGGCATYHRELFDPETPGQYNFKIMGALSPDSGVQLVPKHYKQRTGGQYNFEEGLNLPAFPTCAWNSDTYKVWLAQNQNTHALAQKQAIIQAGAGALASVASVPTGNITGALGGLATAYNALTNVQNLMAQKRDMAIQPDQARGTHSGNINLTHGRMGFTVYTMTVKAEYAKMIDDYFTRYGYQVNTIAVPNLHNRELFTYVKTAGCTVTGTLGAEDQVAIQTIFNRGITFWVDPSKVGEYFNSNRPLSEV